METKCPIEGANPHVMVAPVQRAKCFVNKWQWFKMLLYNALFFSNSRNETNSYILGPERLVGHKLPEQRNDRHIVERILEDIT